MKTLVRRVEVTWPDGRHVISCDPLVVVEYRYPEYLQFGVREVWGYDLPDGSGFHVCVQQEPSQRTKERN